MADGSVEGDGLDFPLEVPEADLLEQLIPVEPAPDDDGSGVGPGAGASSDVEAADADRWEQQQSVPLAEDD